MIPTTNNRMHLRMMDPISFKVFTLAIIIALATPACTSFQISHKCRVRQGQTHLQHSSTSSNNNDAESYRSIADVVGGLHGGKYQFNGDDGRGGGGSAGSLFDNEFSGYGSRDDSCSSNEYDEQDEEMPNWAVRMKPPVPVPPESSLEVIYVPSNSNPMDGMVYSASIVIKNEERTWEKFYAKVMKRNADGEFVLLEKEKENDHDHDHVVVKPRSGDLAPRGGASNACDARKPYSDSVTIQIIHQNNMLDARSETIMRRTTCSSTSSRPTNDLWLVAGIEEDIRYYKLRLLDE